MKSDLKPLAGKAAVVTGAAGAIGAAVVSKYAAIGLTKTAAIECGPMKIRVNSVNPGPIESRMMRAIETLASPGDPGAVHGQFAEQIPFGRYVACVGRAMVLLGVGWLWRAASGRTV